jgi:hypothetical protein
MINTNRVLRAGFSRRVPESSSVNESEFVGEEQEYGCPNGSEMVGG